MVTFFILIAFSTLTFFLFVLTTRQVLEIGAMYNLRNLPANHPDIFALVSARNPQLIIKFSIYRMLTIISSTIAIAYGSIILILHLLALLLSLLPHSGAGY